MTQELSMPQNAASRENRHEPVRHHPRPSNPHRDRRLAAPEGLARHTELGATVIRETLRRAGLSGDDIGTVVMGNAIQAGNRMNPARQAATGGGLPVSVPALTVNHVCGSGAQVILSAAPRNCRR